MERGKNEWQKHQDGRGVHENLYSVGLPWNDSYPHTSWPHVKVSGIVSHFLKQS